ncbi:MAG: TonB-dependent receptor [Opitutaceae bacterium]|nr:TonB-dependent receptor [Opitutaceae bacterium]
MHSKLPGKLLLVFLIAALLLALPSYSAQPATPTATTTAPDVTTPTATPGTGSNPDDAIELSPFEVRAEGDVGYQAANTTSGSRLNSKLKDTPASISPFTAEFLSDIAANTLEEMLGYATNVEMEIEDSNAGFNNPGGRSADANDYTFRMRGMMGGTSRDFVESAVPTDLYNVERADVSSGPNSILFGMGSPGGLVSLTGKRANLNRNRGTLKAQFGSWDFRRYEADYSRVLIPRKLGVRVLGVYQDADGWRKWMQSEQRRFTGAVNYQPFKQTTVRASAETGDSRNNLTVGWNARDEITAWNLAGRPIADGAAVPGTTRLATGTNRYTFFDGDNQLYNTRGELQSNTVFSSNTLVTPDLMPYNYLLTGPGGLRYQNFKTQQVQIEQRFTKTFVAELAWFRNVVSVRADGSNGADTPLEGDPNLTYSNPDGSTGTGPNPRAGQTFMESLWFRDTMTNRNEVVRLTAGWEFDAGRWFGRHRLAGLVENSRQNRLRRWKNEILVDETNTPVSNVNNPEAAANQLFRRHYFAEGDFNNYHGSDPRITVPVFTVGGRQFSPTFVSRTKANTKTKKDIDSFMLASQSFWFKDRLVTTLGYRRDTILFKNANEARVSDPNDPRVLSGEIVRNEWDFDGTHDINRYKPSTFTAGGVLHATRRISLFYNFSKNTGSPRFDRTVLPDGKVPPPTEGRGKDMGVMLDVLGDDRFFVRATYFDTQQINDAPIIPGGLTVNTAGALGGDNLINILNALQGGGRISQEQYDAQAVNYNAATIDVFTKGVELEFVANPTRNLTMRLGYSHSERRRGNFFKEIYAFFDPKYPEWRQLAGGDPTLLATVNREIAVIEDELEAQVARQNSPFGTRPHKFNFTTRYKFSEGRLKGLFAGGGARYQGKNYMQRNNATGQIYWGNETLFVDAFAGHRVRMPWLNRPVQLQLNVRNLTNSYRVGIGRLNDSYDGLRRVYLAEPRSYRLTMTMEF